MTIPPDKSPDKITPGKAAEPIGTPNLPKDPSGFESYMQGAAGKPQEALNQQTAGTANPNPMEVARGQNTTQMGAPTYNSLIGQARNAQDSLGTVQKQIGDPNLKLKRSQTLLARQKLTDAQSHIRAAASKAGVPANEFQAPAGSSTIGRFLAYVNDGQDQLAQVQAKLKQMAAEGDAMRPGDMMAIQVKMSLAQQEIEYTSTLFGKVIDSIKQVMNTQL